MVYPKTDRSESEWRICRVHGKRSGFHRGQIDGILTEMVDAIRSLLSIGQPVTIEGLGTFHTSLTSPGFERPEQVTPGKVSVSRVYFVACPEFSREVKK